MWASAFILISIGHLCFCVDLTYHIEEGKSPGTYIGDISSDSQVIKDISTEDKGFIQFNLLLQAETGSSPLFDISKKSGKLYTSQTLDAESMCIFKKECFQMIDVAIQKGTTVIRLLEVKVVIQDVNDHQPEFPDKQIKISFSEDVKKGTKFLIPNAIDQDVSLGNSKINYKLQTHEQEPFTLSVSKNLDESSKLQLTLNEGLDRETKNSYNIQVIAKDSGLPPKQSILDVHISVIDVNDNPPIFSQNIYNVSIQNIHDKAKPVAIISATDLDAGENSKILYHYSTKTLDFAKKLFQLNEENGEILLNKNPSLGQQATYELYVQAKDGGNPSLSSIAIVTINVINQENNPPKIKVTFVSTSRDNTVEISEDIKVGSFIAYVKVSDQDEGQNGQVKCELNHDKFQLRIMDKQKYQVIVKNTLDREKEEHHDIIIICKDKGSPSLKSKSRFSIKVTDFNDVQPQFAKQLFEFFIDENQRSKVPIGTINATDPDLGLGGKLSFSLVTTNKQFVPFRITESGLISSIMSLDHEFQDTYNFEVFVKDKGSPSLNNTVNVIVAVRDENDNAPYFTFPSVNPYNMDVTYYPHHTKNISQIKASDSDSQENAFLKYEIIRGNSKQIFIINQYTGLLCSTHVLSQQDAGSYELEFLVKDSGSPVLSARTTVYLTLTVSNKTSEMLNAVNIKKDNKIHLTSAIIIVSVAVTIAVIITASISVCILRCCNPRSVPVAEGVGYVSSGQRHLISPPYPANPWSNVALPTSDAVGMRRSSQPPTPRMQTHPYASAQQMLSSTAPKPQATPDSVSQMYIQDIALPSGSDRSKRTDKAIPEFSRQTSVKSSHTNDRQGWADVENMSEIYPSQYCNSPPPQTTEMKSLGHTVSYPSDTTIVARGFYTPYINENISQADSKSYSGVESSSGTSGRLIHSRNLPASGSQISINRPLPAVPH